MSVEAVSSNTPSLSRREAWALTIAATLTMAVSYVDRQTLAVLAPRVSQALHLSEANYGDLASAFSIAYLIGAPLAGRWIDRVGARRGLLIAVLVWSAVAAMHSFAMGFVSLFALRIALGFAEAPSFPGSAQTVHRALPPDDRARGLGVLFTGSSIGTMIAPPLATRLESAFSWRVAFLVTAVVGLLWVPLWLRFAFHRRARALLDAEHEAAKSQPAPSLGSLLKHRAVLRAVCVVLASAPVGAFVLLWASKFLVREFHLQQRDVGDYLWLPPLFLDVGAILFGDLASRRARARNHDGTPPRILVAAAMVLGASLALLPLLHTPWTAVLAASVALAGVGGLYALLTADLLVRVAPNAVSTAGGLCAAAQSIAYVIANPLIGRGVQRLGHYDWITVALGLWVLPGCIVWLLWTPPPVHPGHRATHARAH